MPINPNIALGVQQQQPVNMLGQVGQMLALKAATQEMQSNEEMRSLFAGGANFDDPDFQKRGYMANPKAFQELLGKRATTQKTEMEVLSNDIKLRRDALGDVNTNEDYLKWHDGNHVGRTGAYFKSIGVSPSRESIIAQLNQPGGLEKLKQASALGSTKLQEKLMDEARALKVANIGAAAPLGQLKLAQEEAARKQKEFELIRGIVSSGTSSATASPVNLGGGGVVSTPQGSPVAGTQTPATGAVAQPNVLADQVAPPVVTPAPVNSLLNPPAGQTGAAPVMSQKEQLINQISQLARLPSVEASRALEMKVKEHNVLYPDAKIDQDVDGNLISIVNGRATPVVGLNGLPIKGKPLPSPTITLTEVDDPATPGQKLKVNAQVYKQGTTLGAPGVFGIASTSKLTPAQELKLKGEISKDFEAVQRVVGQTNELLESIDAVRSSNLESVTGQFDARTPSFGNEAQIAETRFNNLKGKVTAIAKANASLGGAIGSIANQEWQILSNQIAVLERTAGKTANLEQIEQLERQAMSIVARMRDGFERQYGGEVERLAPQYKTVPDVNYTPGQYTKTGKKTKENAPALPPGFKAD